MVSINEVSARLKELADKLDNVEQAVAVVRTELQQAKEDIKAELEKLKQAPAA